MLPLLVYPQGSHQSSYIKIAVATCGGKSSLLTNTHTHTSFLEVGNLISHPLSTSPSLSLSDSLLLIPSLFFFSFQLSLPCCPFLSLSLFLPLSFSLSLYLSFSLSLPSGRHWICSKQRSANKCVPVPLQTGSGGGPSFTQQSSFKSIYPLESQTLKIVVKLQQQP